MSKTRIVITMSILLVCYAKRVAQEYKLPMLPYAEGYGDQSSNTSNSQSMAPRLSAMRAMCQSRRFVGLKLWAHTVVSTLSFFGLPFLALPTVLQMYSFLASFSVGGWSASVMQLQASLEMLSDCLTRRRLRVLTVMFSFWSLPFLVMNSTGTISTLQFFFGFLSHCPCVSIPAPGTDKLKRIFASIILCSVYCICFYTSFLCIYSFLYLILELIAACLVQQHFYTSL